jgi:LacI family transcriptional regulator
MANITMRDIAKHAGVGHTTVHLALKDDPSISKATRDRVKAIAEELGYRPNPLLAAYQSSIRSRKETKYQATLAWVQDSDFTTLKTDEKRPFYEAAVKRADVLGFRIDRFQLDKMPEEGGQEQVLSLCRVMQSRGIFGVLLASWAHHGYARMEWPGMTVVCLGLYHPRIGRGPEMDVRRHGFH